MNWQEVQTSQHKVARILTNGIRKKQLVHAYLFIGDKGTGKKEIAYQLAKSYFCPNREGIEPCGECSDCKRIESGNHPDIMYIKPDGRTIKKEQVANLIKEFTYRGMESDKKFFIIEQADSLTAQAANSLLKFIEEPHSQTVAVLLAENRHQLLDTIISRCQLIQFAPLSSDKIQEQLIQEGYAKSIARLASAMTHDINEAKALCEDEWFAKARLSVIHFMEDIFIRSNHAIITLYEEFSMQFNDNVKMRQGLDLIIIWLRDLMNLHIDKTDAVIYIDQIEKLNNQLLNISIDSVVSGLSLVLDAKRRLDSNGHPLGVMEQLALRLQEGAGRNV